MKKLFFQKGIVVFILFLSFQIFGQSVVLTYPLNNSVFQQSSSGNAQISFTGQVLRGSYYSPWTLNNRFYLLIEKYNYSIKQWTTFSLTQITPTDCINCNSSLEFDGKTFYIKGGVGIASFNTGWYAATIVRGFSCTSLAPSLNGKLSQTVTFGVGDVYMIAGQSNAAGFTRQYDGSLMYYESDTFEGTPKISDSDVPEGSIVNGILTDDRTDILRQVGGLSIKPDVTKNKGLVKFTSGKPGFKTEMGIAPNGYDSWAWCRFAKNLVTAQNYPVLLFNTAIPNTSMNQWNNTYFDSHLKKTLQMYGGTFGAKAVLWQQGENETSIRIQSSSYSLTNDYIIPLGSIIDRSRSQAISNLPWVISKTSFLTTVPNPNISPTISTNSLTSVSAAGNQYKNIYPSLISEQGNILSSRSFLYAGPTTEPTTISTSGDLDERYRGPSSRLHFDGTQGAGGKNGLQLLAEKWVTAVGSVPSINNKVAQLPNRIKVTKNNGQYTLTLENPDGTAITSGNFYWVVNDGGIDAKIVNSTLVPNPYSYVVPTSVSQDYYVTCYYQNTLNEVLTPSQPYLVKKTCSGCRIGVGTSTVVSHSKKIIPSGGNTEAVSFSNIGDSFNGRFRNCLPNWISVSLNSNNQLEIVTQANTTSSLRTADVIIEDQSGTAYLTIPIEQAGTTTTCTPTAIQWQSTTGSVGNWQINQAQTGGTMQVNGQQYPNGLSIQVYGSSNYRRFVVGSGFNTFSGLVGRDDATDGCGCGTMDMVFRIKNVATGATLWQSGLVGTNTPAQAFSIPVTSGQEIELSVEAGSDGQSYGDHGDWANIQFSCSAPPACTTPAQPSTPTASPGTTVSAGTAVALSSSCAAGTTLNWGSSSLNGLLSNANTYSVSPTSTTTYYVWCSSGTCTSASKSITINVSTGSPCSAITDGLVLGTWNVTGNQLVARSFYGGMWVTQRTQANPEKFTVRGSAMLQRNDVVLNNPAYATMTGCFSFYDAGYGGLMYPTSSQFSTPAGYSIGYFSDGTPFFLQNSSSAPLNPNGFFDVANCSILHGWAWDAGNQASKVTIEIIENGAVIATGVANQLRSDLQSAGIGNGEYAFTIATPLSLKNGQPHTVNARIANSTYTLNTSPKIVTGCSNMRVAAEGSSQEPKKPLTAAPNPSSGIFSLNFSANIGEIIDLQVVSVAGRTVLTQQFTAESTDVFHVINLEKQPAGEYIVQVLRKDKKETVKVLKVE